MNFLKIDKNDSYANRVAKEVIGKSIVIGLIFGPLSYFAIDAAYTYKKAKDSQATNSPAIVSEYHPTMSSGSDGAGFAEGYARMQISRNIETGLVHRISGGKN